MGTTFLPFPVPPKTSQELTINTSLWTANRNRIHTMHIFINSCPFYKLFAYMNHSSLVTVHLIVGDLYHISVLWCSHDHCAPRPNIIAQEGPIAQGCVSWLWYKHDQLLVAIVECGGRVKSGQSIPNITKVEAGETEILAVMRTSAENYCRRALIHLPLHPNISSPDRASRHSSCSVLFYDVFRINLRQSNSAISTSTLFAERLSGA